MDYVLKRQVGKSYYRATVKIVFLRKQDAIKLQTLSLIEHGEKQKDKP